MLENLDECDLLYIRLNSHFLTLVNISFNSIFVRYERSMIDDSNTSYDDRLYVWRPNTRSAIRGNSNCIIGCRNFLFNGKG